MTKTKSQIIKEFREKFGDYPLFLKAGAADFITKAFQSGRESGRNEAFNEIKKLFPAIKKDLQDTKSILNFIIKMQKKQS